MDKHDDAHAAGIPAARSPTRRRLLALLTSLPAIATPNLSVRSLAHPSESEAEADSISDLFGTFEALLIKHEAALWRCDRLEAWLLAELDHPRVQLPTPAGIPIRYAADADTIAQHVLPGRRRYRLQQVLLRRQQAWIRGARACGLTKAQEKELALDTAIREAAAHSSRPRPEPSAASERSFSSSSPCRNLAKLFATARPGVSCGFCSPTSTPSLSPN